MKTKIKTVAMPIITDDGEFIAHYSENGLAKFNFPNLKPTALRTAKKEIISAKIQGWHRVTQAALKNILAGQKPKKLPPLDMAGTKFQKSVWRELQKIGLGKTKSYGEIACLVGRPKAGRALGGACGANPIPVLVPCHRVLAANKKLGGFSGGLDWKRSLLKREKVEFSH